MEAHNGGGNILHKLPVNNWLPFGFSDSWVECNILLKQWGGRQPTEGTMQFEQHLLVSSGGTSLSSLHTSCRRFNVNVRCKRVRSKALQTDSRNSASPPVSLSSSPKRRA